MTDAPEAPPAAKPAPKRHFLAVTNRHSGVVLINERPGMAVGIDPTATKAVSVPETELDNLKTLTDAGMISVGEITEDDYKADRGQEAFKRTALAPEAAEFPRDRMAPAQAAPRTTTVADLMTGAGSPSADTLAARKGIGAAAAAGLDKPLNVLDFDTMDDAAIKAFIRDRTGEGVRGNPSHETLVTRAKAVQAELEGRGEGSPPSPPAPGDQVEGGPAGDVTVTNTEDAGAYGAAKDAGYPGTLEEWRAAGSPPPAAGSSTTTTQDPPSGVPEVV